MFGWIKHDKKCNVKKVSCKLPISDNPLNDYAVVGAFCFPRAEIFFKNYEFMKKNKILINNEYYIDKLMDILTKKKNLKMISVKKLISWGTPQDYEKNKLINLSE